MPEGEGGDVVMTVDRAVNTPVGGRRQAAGAPGLAGHTEFMGKLGRATPWGGGKEKTLDQLWQADNAPASLEEFVNVRQKLGAGGGVFRQVPLELGSDRNTIIKARDRQLRDLGIFGLKDFTEYLHAYQQETLISNNSSTLRQSDRGPQETSVARDNAKGGMTPEAGWLLDHYIEKYSNVYTNEELEKFKEYALLTRHLYQLSAEIDSAELPRRKSELSRELKRLERKIERAFKRLPIDRYEYERPGATHYEMYAISGLVRNNDGEIKPDRWNVLLYSDHEGVHTEMVDGSGNRLLRPDSKATLLQKETTLVRARGLMEGYIRGEKAKGYGAEKYDILPRVKVSEF